MTYVTVIREDGCITLRPYEELFPPGSLVEIVPTRAGTLIVCAHADPRIVEGQYDRVLAESAARERETGRRARRFGPSVER